MIKTMTSIEISSTRKLLRHILFAEDLFVSNFELKFSLTEVMVKTYCKDTLFLLDFTGSYTF